MARRGAVIRDPVHGDIPVTAEELGVLDTPEIQRLRGVRQLGTAYLVYPGAQHSRFEHSLGTMHLVGRLVAAINRNRALAPRERIGLAEDEERVLRLAALVHDVTHLPFGHSIEDESGLLERHDEPARFRAVLGAGTALGLALDRLGVRREVLAVLAPGAEPGLPDVPPAWREILSDTICPDILDYLRRDAYFTGLNLHYDERVLDYFIVDRATGHLYVDVAKRGMLREDIVSELVRVLEARYFFSERVYYHHAKVAAGAMLARAVANALVEGGLAPEQLHDRTDESLLDLLALGGPTEGPRAAEQAELVARYRSRRLVKRACVFPRYANIELQQPWVERFFGLGGFEERIALEARVAERLRRGGLAEPPLVLLACPARAMQLKEAQTHVRHPDEDGIRPLAHLAPRIPRLRDLEHAYRDLWKLYAFAGTDDPRVLERVAAAVIDELPGATNAYRPQAG